MQTKCPKCGGKYEIQDQYAGIELECPACKTKFKVTEVPSGGDYSAATTAAAAAKQAGNDQDAAASFCCQKSVGVLCFRVSWVCYLFFGSLWFFRNCGSEVRSYDRGIDTSIDTF